MSLLVSTPDLGVAAVAAVINTVCCLLGGILQERLASESLKAVVAWLLVILGSFLLAKLVKDQASELITS